MHRGASLSERSVLRQRRWYLNLYPKADVDTQQPFAAGMMYYGLPDYARHKDHKQLRPAVLDKYNVEGLSREEERVQRVRVMNHRKVVEAEGGRGSAVGVDVPLWEETDESGKGRYKRSWSGAQVVEYHLRNGVLPTSLDPTTDIAPIDPHKVLTNPDPINAAWSLIPSYKPPATTFKQLLPPPVFQELSGRFEGLTGTSLPPTGTDYPQVMKLLSKGVVDSAAGQISLRRAGEWLADFSAALSSASPADDILKQLAAVTRMETTFDLFTSEWNSGINDDDLVSEEGFANLTSGYVTSGGRGFWAAFAALPEVKADYALFLEARLALQETPEELRTAITTVANSFTAIGAILEKRYNRATTAGTLPPRYLATDADWVKVAETYVLKPFQEWAASGEPLKGFESDGSPEWDSEQGELMGILDKKVSSDITVGDWLQWEMLPQYTVPMRIYEKDDKGPVQPYAMLAARFKGLTFANAFSTMAYDHAVHCKARASLYAKPDPDASLVPFVQFLRMVINSSNIQNYNSQMSRAFFLSGSAGAKYTASGELDMRTLPPADIKVYDMNSVIAEMFTAVAARDWTNPESASTAREAARKDAQAVAYLTSLRKQEKYLEGQQEAMAMVRWAAEDVEQCLGHLRRKITAEVVPVEGKVEEVAAPGEWVCGKSGVVTWDWVPEDGYITRRASKEQKEKRFEQMVEEEKAEAARWGPESMVGEVLEAVQKVDAVQSAEETGRHEWAFTKMYHKWQRANMEAEVKRAVGIEHEHRVTVELYKKDAEKLAELKRRRDAVATFQQNASEGTEQGRLALIIKSTREWAVQAYLEKIEHSTGLSEVEAKMLASIKAGVVQEMLETGEYLDESEVDKVGGLWEHQCDLFEKLDETCGNTSRHRVRLPFTRDGALVTPGTYKVKVTGMSNGKPAAEGWSEVVEVTDDVQSRVDGYLRKGRGGKPALLGVDRRLLPASEVQDVVDFLKEDGKGLEFDLVRETKIGSDIFVHTEQGSVMTPVVHLDVLTESIKADHHREEQAADPVHAFISRNDVDKKKVWEGTNPGATRGEWAAAKNQVLKTETNMQWWAEDPEKTWKPAEPNAAPAPSVVHRNAKFTNLFTDFSTPLVKTRYEGGGYVSSLQLSGGIPKMRVPLAQAEGVDAEYRFTTTRSSEDIEETGDSTVSVHIYVEGGKLFVAVGGGIPSPATTGVAFNEEKWVLSLGGVDVRLPVGIEGEWVLSAVSQLAGKSATHSDIPALISPKLHHLSPAIVEAINGAHELHCLHAAVQSPHASPHAEAPLHLPTVIKSWEEAQADIEPPTGLAIERRRFDSWQLNSGKGRFDQSPTKNEAWQHPIEENPNVYGYQDLAAPMSRL